MELSCEQRVSVPRGRAMALRSQNKPARARGPLSRPALAGLPAPCCQPVLATSSHLAQARVLRPLQGVKAGMCTCQIGAFAVVDNERIEQFSSPGQCSENQKKTLPPCAEDPEIGAMSMSQWGDAGVICGVRGGEAVVNTGPEVVLRPEPSDSGTCPTGYQVCGTGSRDTASKICFPAASACPVTDLGAVTSTPTASEFPGLTGTGYSNESQQFLFGWQNPAAAAVISLTVGLGGVCEGSSSGLSYEQSSANLDRLVSRKTSDECALVSLASR